MKKSSVLRFASMLALSGVLLTLLCGWVGAGSLFSEGYSITVYVEGGTGIFEPDPDLGPGGFPGGFPVTMTVKADRGYIVTGTRTNPEIGFTSVSYRSFDMPHSDLEITYILAPGTYDVTTTVEGNGKVEGAASGTFGSVITMQAKPDPGWTFQEWVDLNGNLTDGNLSSAQLAFTMPGGNASLKAVFRQSGYAVTLETAGSGSASATPSSALAGETVYLSPKADAGWRFTGWTPLSPKDLLITGEAFTMPDSPVRVRADFSKLYGIELKAGDGGTARTSVSEGVEGEWVTIQADAKAGHTFLRWEVAKGAVPGLDTASAATDFAMPACDISIRAVFQKEDGTEPPTEAVRFAVVVETQGKGSASAGTVSALEGERVELSAVADNGWWFSRWNVLQGDAVIQSPSQPNTAFLMPGKPVTLQAVFLPEEVQPLVCVLSFDSQGGSVRSPQAVSYGSLAVHPEQPTRTGYLFAGWYRDAACAIPWQFEHDPVVSDITLYAGWTQSSPGLAVVSGILRGGSGGGTSRPDASTVSEKTVLTSPDRKLLADPVISRLKEAAQGSEEGAPLVFYAANVRRMEEQVLRQILQSQEKGRVIYFQTDTTIDNVVQGCIALDLSLLENWEGDLLFGIYTRTPGTQVLKSWMESHFDNVVEVVRLEQQGELEAPFRVAARVDLSALNSETLVFYAYDKEANRCTRLPDITYTWDEDGFLHFQTGLGGDIILTDSVLKVK